MIKDKRFNDPFDPDDGLRVLITRLRPRGLAKERETWHEWERGLAPSLALLKAFKSGTIAWDEYKRRFFAEMQGAAAQTALARLQLVARKRPVTLLCSSACVDRSRCHRSLVSALLAGSEPPGE